MIELPELKAALRVRSDAEDDYIQALEQAAVAYVERNQGRTFGSVISRTDVLRGTGTDTLFIKEYPAAGSAAPVVTEYAGPGAEGTLVTADAADGYILRGRKLVRRYGNVWTLDYEYNVDYSAGYSDGQQPPEIRQAVQQIVAHWYEHRVPVVTGTVAAQIPLSVQAVLGASRKQMV